MDFPWLPMVIGILIALAVCWLALVVALVIARPRERMLKEAMRLLPDVLRLLRRLAADPQLPRGVRLRIGMLIAYLAMPIDVVPDILPVIGYADDAIITALVLRSVARRAGIEALERHWPGTENGFSALCTVIGLPPTARPADGDGPETDRPTGGDETDQRSS